MGLFGADGPEGARPLHDLLSQHASVLVAGMLSAFSCTQDLGLSQVRPCAICVSLCIEVALCPAASCQGLCKALAAAAAAKAATAQFVWLASCLSRQMSWVQALQEASLLMSSYAPDFLPEMFAERWALQGTPPAAVLCCAVLSCSTPLQLQYRKTGPMDSSMQHALAALTWDMCSAVENSSTTRKQKQTSSSTVTHMN